MTAHAAPSRDRRLPALVLLGLGLLVASACGSGGAWPTIQPAGSRQSPSPAVAAVATSPTAPAGVAGGPAGPCAYVPGTAPATMPDSVVHPAAPTPAATATLPPNSTVPSATTKRQLGVLDALDKAVRAEYVDPGLNGVDWSHLVGTYRAAITAGMAEADFYDAMKGLIDDLGDDHSYFDDPVDIVAEASALAGHNEFVGIGASVLSIPESGVATVVFTLPGSPARQAGLEPHDNISEIDGLPIFDAAGRSTVDRLRGAAGTTVKLTIRAPGGSTRTLSIVRAAVNSPLPVESCMITGTGVGYLFLPGLFDETLPAQVKGALEAMTAQGPLRGLIIDNRLNTGGAESILKAILSYFASGNLGSYRSRSGSRPLDVTGVAIANSQTVPLAVMVGPGTVSYGEVMSGILQAQDRAVVVGETSNGNVEVLSAFDLPDGSRVWLAHETFDPARAGYGPWEQTGIRPDVSAPVRWDLFTEANDPGVAAAVKALQAGS